MVCLHNHYSLYIPTHIIIILDCNENNGNVSSSSMEESCDEDNSNLVFEITLSVDEWKTIQPRDKTYIEKPKPKKYKILSPYEWTNIIHEHFFLHTRLPCCLVFKKAKLSFHGIVFLSIRGRCSTCGSIFDGTIDEIPAVNTRFVSLILKKPVLNLLNLILLVLNIILFFFY